MQDGIDRPLQPRDLCLQAGNPLLGMIQVMPKQFDFRVRFADLLEQTAGQRRQGSVRCHCNLVARPHQTVCRLDPRIMLAVIMNRLSEAV